MSDEPDTTPAPVAADPPRGRRTGPVLAVVGVVALLGAAAVVVLGGGKGDGGEEEEPEVAAGEIVAIEPMTLNLSDGRFAKVGVALELVEGVPAAEFEKSGETAKAKDLVLSTVAPLTAAELATEEGRESVRAALREGAEELYPDEYHGLYLTDLVIQ